MNCEKDHKKIYERLDQLTRIFIAMYKMIEEIQHDISILQYQIRKEKNGE